MYKLEIIEKYKSGIEKVASGLGGDYEVKLLSFGDHVRDDFDFNFSDKETDFSGLYRDLDAKFANRNVGAIVIASDGLYNEGSNPVYGPDRLKVPVYTIALGDTTIRKDIVIAKVNTNKMAFLGNNFPMDVWVDARQAAAAHGAGRRLVQGAGRAGAGRRTGSLHRRQHRHRRGQRGRQRFNVLPLKGRPMSTKPFPIPVVPFGPGSQMEDETLDYITMPSGMSTYQAPVLPEPEELTGQVGAVRALRAEAFVFATRLTRLTRQLGMTHPDVAYRKAASAAPGDRPGERESGCETVESGAAEQLVAPHAPLVPPGRCVVCGAGFGHRGDLGVHRATSAAAALR